MIRVDSPNAGKFKTSTAPLNARSYYPNISVQRLASSVQYAQTGNYLNHRSRVTFSVDNV